jgi:hypothetical protein
MCLFWVKFDLQHLGEVEVIDDRSWRSWDGRNADEIVDLHRSWGFGCVVMLHAISAALTPDVIVVPGTAPGAVRTIYVATADPVEIAALTAANAALAADFIATTEPGMTSYEKWSDRNDEIKERFAQAVFLKPAQHEELTTALRSGVAE